MKSFNWNLTEGYMTVESVLLFLRANGLFNVKGMTIFPATQYTIGDEKRNFFKYADVKEKITPELFRLLECETTTYHFENK